MPHELAHLSHGSAGQGGCLARGTGKGVEREQRQRRSAKVHDLMPQLQTATRARSGVARASRAGRGAAQKREWRRGGRRTVSARSTAPGAHDAPQATWCLRGLWRGLRGPARGAKEERRSHLSDRQPVPRGGSSCCLSHARGRAASQEAREEADAPPPEVDAPPTRLWLDGCSDRPPLGCRSGLPRLLLCCGGTLLCGRDSTQALTSCPLSRTVLCCTQALTSCPLSQYFVAGTMLAHGRTRVRAAARDASGGAASSASASAMCPRAGAEKGMVVRFCPP